jgi:hypothetical protein
MNKNKLKSLFILLVLFVLNITFTSQSLAFLDAGASARSSSMGGIYTAVADDQDAIFYNPSGLTQIRKMTVSYTNASVFLTGIENDNLGQNIITLVKPVGSAALGLAYQRIGSNDFSENGLTLSLAKNLSKLNVGINANYLFWSATIPKGDNAASSKGSIGIDAGALINGPFDIKIGAFVKNINQPNISNSGDEGGKLPMDINVGASYKMGSQLIAIDWIYQDPSGVKRNKIGIGLESTLIPELKFRIGGNQVTGKDNEGGQIDAGLGYKFKSLIVDYSYVYNLKISETDGIHKFTFSYGF